MEDQSPAASANGPQGDPGPSPESEVPRDEGTAADAHAALEGAEAPVAEPGDEAPEGTPALPSSEPKTAVGTTPFPRQSSPSTGSAGPFEDSSTSAISAASSAGLSAAPSAASASTGLVSGSPGTVGSLAEVLPGDAPSGLESASAVTGASSAGAGSNEPQLGLGSLTGPGGPAEGEGMRPVPSAQDSQATVAAEQSSRGATGDPGGAQQEGESDPVGTRHKEEEIGPSEHIESPAGSSQGRSEDLPVTLGLAGADDGTCSISFGAGGVLENRDTPLHSNGTVPGSSDATGDLESSKAGAGGKGGEPLTLAVPARVPQEVSRAPKAEESGEKEQEATPYMEEQSGGPKTNGAHSIPPLLTKAAGRDAVAVPQGGFNPLGDSMVQHRERRTSGNPDTGPLAAPARKDTGAVAPVPAGGTPQTPSPQVPLRDPLAAALPGLPEPVRTVVAEPSRPPVELSPLSASRDEVAKISLAGPLGGVTSVGPTLPETPIPAGREVVGLRLPKVAVPMGTNAGGVGKAPSSADHAVEEQFPEKAGLPKKATVRGTGAAGTVLPVVAESSTLLSDKGPSKGGLMLPKQGSGALSPLSPTAQSPSGDDGTLVRSKVDFNPLL